MTLADNVEITKKYDARVYVTIIDILHHFFHKNGYVMLFTCYDQDKKEASRSRLFQRWFTIFATDEFAKVDGNTANTFSSIILHKEHPEYLKIITNFKVFMSYIGDDE